MTRPPAPAVALVALLALGACDSCAGDDRSALATETPPTPTPEPGAAPAPVPASAPASASLAEPSLVTFEGAGAYVLHGSHWEGAPGSPAVVLLHQVGADRTEWSPVILALVEAGFSVLAYDQRGHGASVRAPDGSRRDPRALSTEEWRALPEDVGAALRWLAARDAPPRAVVLGGSSVGSSAALVAGAAAPEGTVAGIFVLSPGRRYRGIDAVAPLPRYGGKLLAVAAEAETGAVDMLRTIDRLADGADTLVVEGATAHGLRLLGDDATLLGRLVTFVRNAARGSAP
ncbi:MAG: alpha/beta fold hydrolase [Myxococcota bacterium]